MKKIVLGFLFCSTLYSSVYAQKGDLKRDYLPVFIIQNEELASIVDDFIVVAQNIDSHTPTAYNIYISLFDNHLTDEIHFLLDRRKLNESSDSLIVYKNPHYHQAFIWHKNLLFRLNVHSYADSFNYHLLTAMLKVLPDKQIIFLKDPPSDFYDLNRRGGNPLEDTLLDSFHEFDGTKWYNGLRTFENEPPVIIDLSW